jgi:hypothetical protein
MNNVKMLQCKQNCQKARRWIVFLRAGGASRIDSDENAAMTKNARRKKRRAFFAET